jgi:hypothetical protein
MRHLILIIRPATSARISEAPEGPVEENNSLFENRGSKRTLDEMHERATREGIFYSEL